MLSPVLPSRTQGLASSPDTRSGLGVSPAHASPFNPPKKGPMRLGSP